MHILPFITTIPKQLCGNSYSWAYDVRLTKSAWVNTKPLWWYTGGYIIFMTTCIYYPHVASARFERSLCHGLLMTIHTICFSIHLTRVFSLTTKRSHCSKCENHRSLVLPHKQYQRLFDSSNSDLLNHHSFKIPADGNLWTSFFANLIRITEILPILSTLTFNDN